MRYGAMVRRVSMLERRAPLSFEEIDQLLAEREKDGTLPDDPALAGILLELEQLADGMAASVAGPDGLRDGEGVHDKHDDGFA